MIYIQVDLTEASEEDRAAIKPRLDALESNDVSISYFGVDEKLDELKERLFDFFRNRKISAGEVFGEREKFRLMADTRFDPIEKKLLPVAIQAFCDEGLFELEDTGRVLRLTQKGERDLYQ